VTVDHPLHRPDLGGADPTGVRAVPGVTAASMRTVAREGARDMVPMAMGVAPFGIALGAFIGASSIDPWAGLASAPLILAGAAQLATLQMLEAGSSPAVIIVSALLINLRLLLYGTSLAPWFRCARLRTRLLLAVPVIDQTHFVCVARFERGDLDHHQRIAYYTGAAACLIGTWLGTQTAALALGASLPAAARLDMAAPLALVGLLAKSVADRASFTAAAVAVAVASVGAGLPLHAATLVATVVAINTAVVVDKRYPGARRSRDA
jgi:predicted branched-subunit amino acid permease